jgi:hypothetical protein
MRTVYGPGGSGVRLSRTIQLVSAITIVGFAIFLIGFSQGLAGNTGPTHVSYCGCGTGFFGFAVGLLLVLYITKRRREAQNRERQVIVEDRGVIAYGNYLLWDEIKELQENPWEGYRLVFRRLNKETEPLRFVTIDEFPHFDHFIKQLRDHGVEIKINHW